MFVAMKFMFQKLGKIQINIYRESLSIFRIEKVRMEKSKIDLESCDGVSEYEFPVKSKSFKL